MICLVKNRLILLVVCLLRPCSADFSCICSYKVELSVYEQSNKTSTGIGYMYEFDCKPQVQDVEVGDEWFVIMYEKKMGYIEKDANVVSQVCPGSIPATDLLPTTPTSTLFTSAIPLKTTQSTSTRAPEVSTITPQTTTVTPNADLTIKSAHISTVVTTSSSASSSTSETIATVLLSSLSNVMLMSVLSTSSTTKPMIGTNLPVASSSSGTFDAKIFREQLELCRSINTSHLLTHTYITGYCYEFVTYGPRIQALAELHCKLHGGHLLSITTGSEDAYIQQIIKTHSKLQNATFWTGFSIHGNTSAWADGSSTLYAQYIRWENHGFDAATQCVVIKSSMTENMWQKIDCLSDHEFICKYATTQVSPTPIHGLTSRTVAPATTATTEHGSPATTIVSFARGYMQLCPERVKALEQNGNHVAQNDSSCYVLFQSPDQWSSARDICTITSGHMLTINSLTEQVFIEEFLMHYGIRSGVWLGLNDLDMEGNFTWVTGESVTFTHWESHHEDDIMSDFHDCVELLPTSSGVWRTTLCSKQGTVSAQHGVVCEYDAIRPIVNAIIG